MRMMINRIVDRHHVAESLETVIRGVISRLADGFKGYREMKTADKAAFVQMIALRWKDNRDLYNSVVSGKF